MGRITTTIYDALDRPTVVIDPMGNRTTTTYDADGEKLTVTDPMGRVTTTTYNVRGWVATQTNPLGFTTTYTYNNIGQVTEIGQPASSGGGGTSGGNTDLTITTTTTTAGDSVRSTRPAHDHVPVTTAWATRPPSRTPTATRQVMLMIRRIELTTITDALGHTTVYGYDADGEQTTVTDGLGHTTTTLYDADGRATTMIAPWAGPPRSPTMRPPARSG